MLSVARVTVRMLAVLSLLYVAPASANPYDPSVIDYVVLAESNEIPSPTQVAGKEFSARLDRDALGVADPQQGVLWDGAGGTQDGFDYQPSPRIGGEVDGLANSYDAFFTSLHREATGLLFSVSGSGDIQFERPDGTFGLWAAASTIDAMNPPSDIDGLELWGLDQAADSDRFSLEGDPGVAGGPGVSVWAYDESTTTTTALIFSSTIGSIIGLPDNYWQQIDLDGLMVNTFTDVTGGLASSLFFSVAPIVSAASGATILDGGEIWYWDGVSASASFLVHGAHTWDTAFDVMGTFGLGSENINAIEAGSYLPVPEPSTALLLVSALLGAGMLGRQKRSATRAAEMR